MATDYELKSSLPNKSFNEDGTITDLLGNVVENPVIEYENMPSLPNKWLNPDGTYSTLLELISGAIDTELFIVVEELPQSGETNKIYLLVDGDNLIEYLWTGSKWDPIGMVQFDISQYSTTEQMNAAIAAALNSAKNYADTNFLKKDNTTAYTPTQNYHPATKLYVDQKAVTFKAFPNEFITNSTTQAFLNSIITQNLPVGMAYLGQVSLSDMPDGVTVQAEVEVYIYPQNVAYCVMRSAEVSPYIWECNSYENRGWEAIDSTAKSYADTNFLKKNNTTVYTPTADYHPATKKYVDDSISLNITQVLGGSY